MTRYALALSLLLIPLNAVAAPYVPPGLQPGDQYQLIFATSILTAITVDTSVPPLHPFFGGIPAADYTVNYVAYQSGLLQDWNSEDIIYHAVLSTSSINARDHVPILAPVYNTNGDLVATGAADLWDGTILSPVKYDEQGVDITVVSTSFAVWSGTKPDGTWSSNSLGEWNNTLSSANIGDLSQTNETWIKTGLTFSGSSAARLYGVSPVLTVVPEPASFLMLGLGGAAVFLAARRRAASKPRA